MVEPYLFSPYEVVSARAFYNLKSGSYNGSRGLTGGPDVGQTICCRAQRSGVANDVLYDISSVEPSCPIVQLH
jgi:hypothetical protein